MDAVHGSSESSALCLFVLKLFFKGHVRALTGQPRRIIWQSLIVNSDLFFQLLMVGRINESTPGIRL